MTPHPQKFRGREARERYVGNELGQPFPPNPDSANSVFFRSPAIVPKNGRANDAIMRIQYDKPCIWPPKLIPATCVLSKLDK
jgi:hypothetical protein